MNSLNWRAFWWKLAKGTFSGLTSSTIALSFTDGGPTKYLLGLLGAAISGTIHGATNALDQIKPKEVVE
jgi:hypothetical protein